MADKAIGNLKGRITMEIDDAVKKMHKIRDELSKTGQAGERMKEDFDRIQLGGAAIFTAVTTAVGVAVKTAADFEKQMSRVKAISGATEGEFKSLKEEALRLGATTSKSAGEVAKGMEDMAAMGFNVNEIIAAMPGVISAAEASGSDLATTAGIVASALNSFQMEAADANKVADILATTANISAAGIDDMGYALKYAAPIANTLGIGIEEVSAAIGIMTNAGLEGSQAGTSLRQILISLSNPTKAQMELMDDLGISMKDSNGKAKDLAGIVEELAKATDGMTESEKLATVAKLVGTEAASGMITMLDGGVDQLEDFTEALKNSEGASKATADVMKDNLSGSVEEFTGALETLGIKVGDEVAPLFRELVDAASELVEKLIAMDSENIIVAGTFVAVAAGVGTVLATIGKLSAALMVFTATPVGAAIVGVSLLAGAIGAVAMAQKDAKEVNLEHANALIEEQSTLDSSINRYDALREKTSLSNDQILRYLDLNKKIAQEIDPTKIEAMKDEQAKLQEKSGLTNDEFAEMLEHNQKLIDMVPESTSAISDQGSVLIENTDAAKGLNDELREKLRLELESQLAKANENEAENLREQTRLVEELKEGYKKTEELKKIIFDDTVKLSQVESDLAKAQEENDTEKINRLAVERGELITNLGLNKEELSFQADKNLKKQSELDLIDEQIRLGKEAKQGLVDLVMSQTDINAEKGKEIAAIDKAIDKLETEKKKLQNITPEAEKNTQEYRDSLNAIDDQISHLETTKRKVVEITGQVELLNQKLGQSVTKTVYIKGGGSTLNGPTLQRHSGGLVDGPEGKMHTGGFVANLIDNLQRAPQHNEVDVRLLRNEMVLTESQQANLMRVIDAGTTVSRENTSDIDSELLMLLRELRTYGIKAHADVYLDDYKVSQELRGRITDFQNIDQEIKRIFEK